jgi:hypothetical protein
MKAYELVWTINSPFFPTGQEKDKPANGTECSEQTDSSEQLAREHFLRHAPQKNHWKLLMFAFKSKCNFF